jgi:hypothetical protein
MRGGAGTGIAVIILQNDILTRIGMLKFGSVRFFKDFAEPRTVKMFHQVK